MTRAFLALIARDLRLAARVGGSGALGLVFFLMIVTIVPFALGPDLNLLARIGPAMLWLAAVLATLIGLDRLFQADEEDGSLDLLRQSPLPLELVVLAKAIAHWLTTGLPLALAAPLFGLLVALTPPGMAAMVATLLVGTPALTFIGAIGAALTSGIRRGGLILADPRPAADDPDADLRRLGRERGARRHRALRDAVPDPLGAVARRRRHRHRRRRRRAPLGGVGRRPLPCPGEAGARFSRPAPPSSCPGLARASTTLPGPGGASSDEALSVGHTCVSPPAQAAREDAKAWMAGPSPAMTVEGLKDRRGLRGAES